MKQNKMVFAAMALANNKKIHPQGKYLPAADLLKHKHAGQSR